ncbi:olfactory receptor 2K2-like protein [Lates japonicus]|uniref:Olfactory receptor 2K2-like protein n=1 Tax=Lates japonicus TaxID=270547 RepID=A0AAD3NF45_LATJO|nr:olfactory receptor 2K2-like protein [Lates japonicus]
MSWRASIYHQAMVLPVLPGSVKLHCSVVEERWWCVIVIDKNLHRPMFVMVCNLVVCDLLGATTVLPRLMMHFLTGERRIAYIPAIAQAFSLHTYGKLQCRPFWLQYYLQVSFSSRTSARLHCCCALAWFVAVLCIAVFFGFHMNVPLRGNIIKHVYSSNRAILSLACRSTPTNNIYGQCIGLE